MGRKAKLPGYFTPPDDFAVLDNLARRIAKSFRINGAAVFFYDATVDKGIVLSSLGLPQGYSKNSFLLGTHPIVHWMREASMPFTVNDLAQDREYPDFAICPGAQSMIWFPLYAAAETFGCLAAFSREPNYFKGSDLDMLDVVATQTAAIVELYLKLDEVTITDHATGLRDRGYLFSRLKEEAARSVRYLRPLSVVGVRVIPAALAPGAERELLSAIGTYLQGAMRKTDVAGRYKNMSFGLLLSETPQSGAEIVTDKVQKSLPEHLARGEPRQRVTIRACSMTLEPDQDPSTFVAETTAALDSL